MLFQTRCLRLFDFFTVLRLIVVDDVMLFVPSLWQMICAWETPILLGDQCFTAKRCLPTSCTGLSSQLKIYICDLCVICAYLRHKISS